MKNKMKKVIEYIIILLLISLIILFLQIDSISIRSKLILLNVCLVSICIKYREFRKKTEDERSILFVIRWYGLLLIIIISTIAIFFVE